MHKLVMSHIPMLLFFRILITLPVFMFLFLFICLYCHAIKRIFYHNFANYCKAPDRWFPGLFFSLSFFFFSCSQKLTVHYSSLQRYLLVQRKKTSLYCTAVLLGTAPSSSPQVRRWGRESGSRYLPSEHILNRNMSQKSLLVPQMVPVLSARRSDDCSLVMVRKYGGVLKSFSY